MAADKYTRAQQDIGTQMQQLYQRFGELPGITIELHKDLLAVHVSNQQASARIFLQGAQLTDYQIKGAKPLIWTSPQCDYRAGTALRGGIPICWPWFGDLTRNNEAVRHSIVSNEPQAAHGLVRNRLWQLDNVEVLSEAHTRLGLSLTLADKEVPAWPYATRMQLQVDIGARLQLSLSIENRSSQTVNFSAALHSYFSISNIDNINIDGFDGCDYLDCLQDWQRQQQQGTITIQEEIDRVYYTQAPHPSIRINDPGWQRSILLDNTGSHSSVVWNPWIDKSQGLSHFANDAYKDMVCIETANAADDFVRLAAGESHELGLILSREPNKP